jgi:hypothetical protein
MQALVFYVSDCYYSGIMIFHYDAVCVSIVHA